MALNPSVNLAEKESCEHSQDKLRCSGETPAEVIAVERAVYEENQEKTCYGLFFAEGHQWMFRKDAWPENSKHSANVNQPAPHRQNAKIKLEKI